MNIFNQLNSELMEQSFSTGTNFTPNIASLRQIAQMYAFTENTIAVLSDIKTNTSYIAYGKIGVTLGLVPTPQTKEIQSIWESDIFNIVHPDDLLNKHLQELRFLNFLKTIPHAEKEDFYSVINLQMRLPSGAYIQMQHRMFYVTSQDNGNIHLALCIYGFAPNIPTYDIINTKTGKGYHSELQDKTEILTKREKEILSLIEQGKLSKEIASRLSISINTVNRHRQNILEKLRVGNALEACKIAKALQLL